MLPLAAHSARTWAHVTGAHPVGPAALLDSPVTAAAYDTRLLLPPADGVLFLALSSPRRSGEQFVGQAYKAGVRLFCTTLQPAADAFPDALFLVVPDVLTALGHMARWHREQFRLPVVGITGSNGKTVVKEWLSTLCEPHFQLVKSPRSFNSQLGVPLSVLQLSAQDTLALFEAGISQAGEMARLADVIRPTVGIFTHFGDAHAEGFTSDAHKLAEKCQLFTPGSTVLTPAAQPQVARALRHWGVNVLTVGADPTAHYRLVDVQDTPTGWTFGMVPPGASPHQAIGFNLHQSGQAALENAALCLAAAHHLGVPAESLQALCPKLLAVSMRTEIVDDNPEITVISDAYNADRASCLNAFSVLQAQRNHARRLVILSDLDHQGGRAQAIQAELLTQAVRGFGADAITAIGPLSMELAPQFPGLTAYPDTEAFLQDFHYKRFRDAAVLVKGARRFAFERILPYLNRAATATYLKINLNALIDNLHTLRALAPPTAQVIAMVKAAAYGSGAWQVAQELVRNGVDVIAVAYTHEGIELRNKGLQVPILVLNPDETTLEQLFLFRLEPCVGSPRLLSKLLHTAAEWSASKPEHALHVLPIHIEADTGMHRLGFSPEEWPDVLERLTASPLLWPETMFTHLTSADDPAAHAHTAAQLALFDQLYTQAQAVFPFIKRHAQNTAGVLGQQQARYDYVRFGIGLYGINPLKNSPTKLHEVGSLHTVVARVRHYPAGEAVGYNQSQTLTRPTTLATLSVGYADGVSRRLGNGAGRFLVNGHPCPTVGRICMDMCMVDATDVPTGVREGDEAVLFGYSASPHDETAAFQSVEAVAQAQGTIAYEVLSGIGARVRRLYVKE